MTDSPGHLRISKTTSTEEPDFISIELIDNASGARVRAKVSLSEFAQAITGQSVDITATWKQIERLGYRVEREKKTTNITWPSASASIATKEQAIDKAVDDCGLSKHGWKVFDYGFNSQQNERGSHSFTIERLVKL